jgi:hypothetical protein
LAILPVSNEISLPEISTETRVTSLLIFTAFLFRPSVGGLFCFLVSEPDELSELGADPFPQFAVNARLPVFDF